MKSEAQKIILERLKKQITGLETFKATAIQSSCKLGFAPIEKHFPNKTFPTGTIHEFIAGQSENTACTSAFIFAILAKVHANKGIYIWIGKQRQLFAAGLKPFGIPPHQIIFINLAKPKDILWATEEALKCKSIGGVISEMESITFAQSQRLQLTVEKSGVTGFILRTHTENINATTCAARWQISPAISENENNLPGVGFANWQVNLLKVRNGSPASFGIAWRNGQFHKIAIPIQHPLNRKAVG